MDGEGHAEVVFGAVVFDSAGRIVFEGLAGRGIGGQGPISCVADLDGDGRPELIAGNTAYQTEGSVAGGTFAGSVRWTAQTPDGYCGVAGLRAPGPDRCGVGRPRHPGRRPRRRPQHRRLRRRRPGRLRHRQGRVSEGFSHARLAEERLRLERWLLHEPVVFVLQGCQGITHHEGLHGRYQQADMDPLGVEVALQALEERDDRRSIDPWMGPRPL